MFNYILLDVTISEQGWWDEHDDDDDDDDDDDNKPDYDNIIKNKSYDNATMMGICFK